jgi:hypothetical protein
MSTRGRRRMFSSPRHLRHHERSPPPIPPPPVLTGLGLPTPARMPKTKPHSLGKLYDEIRTRSLPPAVKTSLHLCPHNRLVILFRRSSPFVAILFRTHDVGGSDCELCAYGGGAGGVWRGKESCCAETAGVERGGEEWGVDSCCGGVCGGGCVWCG